MTTEQQENTVPEPDVKLLPIPTKVGYLVTEALTTAVEGRLKEAIAATRPNLRRFYIEGAMELQDLRDVCATLFPQGD